MVRSGAPGDPSATSFPVGLTASVTAGSDGPDGAGGAGCPGVAVALPATRFDRVQTQHREHPDGDHERHSR